MSAGDPRVLYVMGIYHSGTTVLSNLIGNAVKFTPEGGRIVVEATPVDGEMRLTVADNGPGIPPENLERVFDPYWQARSTARLGAGLGLPIAKGVIESHGDHRLAMMGAIAGMASQDGVEVVGMDAAAVSYPRFMDDFAALA
jgi:C4-dicarboxylate-specific signal transduction histidine kinase